ncbi:MAG: serine/threonine-protein kinase [Planctomycetota bacterium]
MAKKKDKTFPMDDNSDSELFKIVGKALDESDGKRAQEDRVSLNVPPESKNENSTDNPLEIGPYKLIRELGEGGMGTVFLAEQQLPVRRQVALKVIKEDLVSKEVVARFEAERQALALMDHQNIAKVFDAGTTESGCPYFVMELVKGIQITDYCDNHKLAINERLKLFVDVCRAVQHAHQKGVLHRDLKPSNILVTLYEGQPMAKVIDFGLAKAVNSTTKLSDKSFHTEFGRIVGTVRYMSPEQAQLDNLDIDSRTDIYSLGVVLYELLTGTTPIERNTVKEEAILSVLATIQETDAPKPSDRLTANSDSSPDVSERRKIGFSKLKQILKGELDWVVLKALEKDRTRRYDTAASLADDISRYLNQEAVVARPPTASYRLSKFVAKIKRLSRLQPLSHCYWSLESPALAGLRIKNTLKE